MKGKNKKEEKNTGECQERKAAIKEWLLALRKLN